MNALTLARPYARAAFESALAANALTAWSEQIGFAALAANDARVCALIGDPRLSEPELVGLLLPPGDVAESPFGRFLSLLADNHRLPLLPEIAALFAELRREAEQIVKVTLRTATPVSEAQTGALKAALKKRFGREIEMEQRIDPGVIGGAVIDAGDVVIDGSVRGRLERLESALAL